MFIELDSRPESSVAAIDYNGGVITYGELCSFSKEFYSHVDKRALIFILSENRIGSLAGYIASITSKVVPLLLGSNIDRVLLKRLVSIYQPEYIWLPEELSIELYSHQIFNKYGFSLVRTNLTGLKLHNDLALLLTTSGSTGSPKLVRHSYSNIEASARNVSAFFELTESERAIAILPMQYTMGLSVVTSHLYAGATILLIKGNLTDKGLWEFVKKQKATSFTGVPFSYEILYKLHFFRMDLPSLQLLTQGGGKLRDELFREFAEFAARTGKRFIATYGQTEGTARMAYLPALLATKKTGSIGKAIPNGELSLIDENGSVLKEIEAFGEMVYKGPNVTLGYAINGTDLQKGDENNGLLRTGDIARRDSDGYYYIIGRISRFLKLFGLRISLDETEHMIKSNFNIDCICTGNDERMRILITDRLKKEDIHKFVIEKTGLFHKAVEVEVVEEIPKNEAGKTIYQ